jgi:hypothetical protein
MNEPELIHRERTLLRDLASLMHNRAESEDAAEQEYLRRKEQASEEFRAARAMLRRFKLERETAEKEWKENRERLTTQFQKDYNSGSQEFHTLRADIMERYQFQRNTAKEEYRESRWTTKTVYEAAKGAAEDRRNETTLELAATLHELHNAQQQAMDHLKACRQQGVYAHVTVTRKPIKPEEDALGRVHECRQEADELLAELKGLSLPGFLRGLRPVWFLLAMMLLAVYPAGYLLTEQEANPLAWGERWPLAVAFGGAGGLTIGLAILAGIWYSARSQLTSAYQPLRQAVFDGELLKRRCEAQANIVFEKEQAKVREKRDRELKQWSERYHKGREALKKTTVGEYSQARTKYVPALASLKQRASAELREAHERYRRCRQATAEGFRHEKHRMVECFRQARRDAKKLIRKQRADLTRKWEDGVAKARREIASLSETGARHFPDWLENVWNQWEAPTAVTHALRFGELRVTFEHIDPEVAGRDWAKVQEPFTIPALLPFPHNGSILLKCSDAGRTTAVHALQNLMMRYLTHLPPGKVRFTIIDPIGLGENFAAFMHLADHDEQLVASRIWTEQAHIEQRLADLTAHMENVIQKYLRNQFETIEDYNVHAGEVAEPYRVLVIANFPANFTHEAMRRLQSIVGSGARCGVYTLLSVDAKQRLPEGSDFQLDDLEQSALTLEWDGRRFTWRDRDFGAHPLLLDQPPSNDFCTRILQVVGARAKEAKRVEVPFEFVAPRPEEWWTGDTRPGLNVPLGRAGATKRQHLRLGHGTSQHVLIAGKTGSGKSTLLHALITNASLLYKPSELELYLVDFKKGVEFKTYAVHELPHARVIAIESEREFGLSVLQRLDAELKARADRFREVGAQELAAYRNSNGSKPCPRVLLIVDEFQEFFVEDDKIAQEAALLLDRLVRQGRAFGIHVLLGSQTLGGAYTLARSTIDQMAVRIALQCSEADGHIILSEDNSAARLLSRPGEAIYNDANGLVEGNDPFQVVWLADEKREDYLQEIQKLATRQLPGPRLTQIVFEGNAPADATKNPYLVESIQSPRGRIAGSTTKAWLGEAIAIKDPTAVTFRSQSGSNLLLIGQQEEAACGILATALFSLASQLPPAESLEQGPGARFHVLDGSSDDSPVAGVWPRMAETVPHPVEVVGWRGASPVVAALHAEMERRQQSNDVHAARVFVLIQGLQRFRDLRRNEEDFGFSVADAAPSAAKQFGTLLRDGPGFGIHCLCWCDTLNNFQRTLERLALRDFENRVLFQMGAADSSNLIDSPLASKLGIHRAIFFSEEQGKLEKFRPYGVPTEPWMRWVREHLESREAVPA